MSIILQDKVENPTYCYINPVKFNGENHPDSRSLVQALLNEWDYAVTTFKCGDWNEFWHTCVDTDTETKDKNKKQFEEIYNAMWEPDNNTSIDILFTKAIHFFEPALKEIPCFLVKESMSLWGGEQFREFFKRKLYDSEQKYLYTLMCTNLESSWNSMYEDRKADIRYACQLLREQIFSLYGYVEPEKEFLALLSGKMEASKGTKEDFVRVYQGVADKMHQVKGFSYKDKECTSLKEFGALWKDECDKWSIKEWNAFLEILYEEKEGVLSFRPWLLYLGEQKLMNCLEEWKAGVPDWKSFCDESEISKFPGHRRGASLESYNIRHSRCRSKLWPMIPTYKSDARRVQEFIKENSKKLQAEMLREHYRHIYQYLEESIEHMPKYESSTLGAELDALIKKWDAWEDEGQRIYEDQKMIIEAIEKHDVPSCWNHNFTYKHYIKGKEVDSRQHLALLACAPLERSYQKDCEAFVQFIEAGGEGCAPEDVQRYVEAIFEYIYMPIVREVKKPGAEIENTIDEIVEYYFRLLERLSAKLPAAVELSDILSNKEYKELVFDNPHIQSITSKLASYNNLDKWWVKQYKERYMHTLNEYAMEHYHTYLQKVDYKTYLAEQKFYERCETQERKIDEIGKELIALSRRQAELNEEWNEYLDENYNKKSIAELCEAVADKEKYAETVIKKEKELHSAIREVEYLCHKTEKAWEEYVDWGYAREKERREIEELEAKKSRSLVEKLKNLFSHQ